MRSCYYIQARYGRMLFSQRTDMTFRMIRAHNYGSLVKRLRRRPLTAETAVRFRYELREVLRTQTK